MGATRPATADRRGRGSRLRRQWRGGRRPVPDRALAAAAGARGLVFPLAGAAALKGATLSPLAFAIHDTVNRLAAGAAAVGCLVAARRAGRFVAPRPVAQRPREKNFCCVTTRRRSSRFFQGLWHRLGVLAARPLRLGVLAFGRIILASFGLPPRRLPAPHQAQAGGVLAVALVPPPRLKAAATAFTQAKASPQSSAAAVWLMLTVAHGSDLSQGTARGERVNVLLGRFSTVHVGDHRQVYFAEEIRQARRPLDKGPARKTTSNQTAKKTVLEIHARRIRRTTTGWLSSDARNWLSFFARCHRDTAF